LQSSAKIGSNVNIKVNQTSMSTDNSSVWLGPIATSIDVKATTFAAKRHSNFAAAILRAMKQPFLNNKNNTTPNKNRYKLGLGKNRPLVCGSQKRKNPWIGFDEQSRFLSRAVWNEDYFAEVGDSSSAPASWIDSLDMHKQPLALIEKFEVPKSISDYKYNPERSIDTVWQVMRYEAMQEAQREPLLVSFLFSTILNHETLESALAFHLANLLSSPAMISTEVMSLCLEALQKSQEFRKSLRLDLLAVRDRDPACTCLPDAFLYFKGFHALQTYRVAHYLWKSGRTMLAQHLQSQMSHIFQVDIHPNATLGQGIMLDHGTGIVIGGTAVIGHNCSILHHVTLGGTGKLGVDRHPEIGNGVLIGTGASILGNICIGNGCQIGAGTLVIQDLPPHCVVVGVPAKIIGSFINVEMQPSLSMDQTLIEYSELQLLRPDGGMNI
jgi:serine O-acetyltransferase